MFKIAIFDVSISREWDTLASWMCLFLENGSLDMRSSRERKLLARRTCSVLENGGYSQIFHFYGKLMFCSAAREITHLYKTPANTSQALICIRVREIRRFL